MRTKEHGTVTYASSNYVADWKGEIHSYQEDLYWGGDKPLLATPTKENPVPQYSQNVFFSFSSLEKPQVKDTPDVFEGKFAFYENARKAGHDVTVDAEGKITHTSGVDGSSASTWLPYTLWEKCKTAGIKTGECSKDKYDAYVKSLTTSKAPASTAPPTSRRSFFEQDLWGFPVWGIAAVGGSLCCACFLMIVVVLVLKKRGKASQSPYFPPYYPM